MSSLNIFTSEKAAATDSVNIFASGNNTGGVVSIGVPVYNGTMSGTQVSVGVSASYTGSYIGGGAYSDSGVGIGFHVSR